ncbi:hypothetical protein SDC9_68130 [bioreactor metagenome]|uniref:Uncharacterized protein n=1 Tax=bioreactor metagenome TaxID=1076179 RepID=A0A644XZL1_9ZZZZ
MPFSNTIKSFSSRITWADSFAMSTAVSTEMPTSDAFMAVASLIPSPIYPTTWPFSLRSDTMVAFCCGESFAKTFVTSTAFFSSSSDMRSTSEPSSRLSTCKPTCLQMQRVTRSLSPVRIFTATPCSFSALIAAAVVSFGGSRKARYPISTMSASSVTENAPTGDGLVFCATAITRIPSSLRRSTVARISSLTALVSGSTLPLYSA